MTTLEMHIGVNLLVQKINSNIISSLKSEEIDFFLNQEVYRFINDRTSPDEKGLGFQDSSKRLEDLKGLISVKKLPVYINDTNSVLAYIPSNCLKLIKDRSLTKDLCGAAYAPVTTVVNIHYAKYQFVTTGANFYTNFQFRLAGVLVFDTANYPNLNSFVSYEQKFELVDFMMEKIRDAGYEVKYENYIGINGIDSLIITRTSASFTMGVKYGAAAEVVTASLLTDDLNKITEITGTTEVENILNKNSNYIEYLNSSFGTTLVSSPLSVRREDSLFVYHKQKFIISSVNVEFIRIPRKISLPLSQNCDLDASVHQEIVDNTARRIAGVTTAENYQQLLRENLNKE